MNEQEFEERLSELRKKYTDLLREGRTEDATEVWRESVRVKKEYNGESEEKVSKDSTESGSEEVSDEESRDEELERFEALKGIGDELAIALYNKFGSVEDMAEASKEDLTPLPGIGEKRAESLLKQVEKNE